MPVFCSVRQSILYDHGDIVVFSDDTPWALTRMDDPCPSIKVRTVGTMQWTNATISNRPLKGTVHTHTSTPIISPANSH